jgi:hypothetical protein
VLVSCAAEPDATTIKDFLTNATPSYRG